MNFAPSCGGNCVDAGGVDGDVCANTQEKDDDEDDEDDVMLTIMVGPTHRRRPHYVRECQARQQTLPLPTTNDRTNMKKTNYQE